MQFAEKYFIRLIKNVQSQVKLCEIPLAGAPEISRREHYAFPTYSSVHCNKPVPLLTRGRMRGGVATNKERLLVTPLRE